MELRLDRAISLLAKTPAALAAFLADLPEAWTSADEGPNTWSPREVIGHLNYGEMTDWMPRIRWLLKNGESVAFEPFERDGHRALIEGKSIQQLLSQLARLRAEGLQELSALHLRPEDLQRCGRHPDFGSVSLGQLISTWAAHDLTHLHQISRTMAFQLREEVGPWRAYLGVMKCNGHSFPA